MVWKLTDNSDGWIFLVYLSKRFIFKLQILYSTEFHGVVIIANSLRLATRPRTYSDPISFTFTLSTSDYNSISSEIEIFRFNAADLKEESISLLKNTWCDWICWNNAARKNKPLTTRKFLCVVDSDVIEVKGITIEELSKRNQYVWLALLGCAQRQTMVYSKQFCSNSVYSIVVKIQSL